MGAWWRARTSFQGQLWSSALHWWQLFLPHLRGSGLCPHGEQLQYLHPHLWLPCTKAWQRGDPSQDFLNRASSPCLSKEHMSLLSKGLKRHRITQLESSIKQPICPLTDEWIKKMWYIHTMEYYSAIKRNKIGSF